jgi:anaerobic selenocysteine-containing dehydrogenase
MSATDGVTPMTDGVTSGAEGAPPATDWKQTACILCECNCGIEVQLDGRSFARIRGDKAHPASQGYTCNKAMRLDHYQNGRHRLASPLRRRADGTFEAIPWDVAIDEVASRFASVRGEFGGETIFYYGGGGQGNHLGGAYGSSFMRALGARYRSSALAQEKMGEWYVDSRLYGGHTRGDFENAEVAVFIGKNPWQSQSFPRARVTLREISRDANRALIVIDPVRTETAVLADFHLRVRPGTDAWALAALLATIVQEGLADDEFLDSHTNGAAAVRDALAEVPVASFADRCGVDVELIRDAARRIAAADSVSTFEDLGIQQGPHSVLCSYLNKLLWALTGNYAKPGGMHLHSWLQPLARHGLDLPRTPVTGDADRRRPRAVQRDRRGDPHRPSGANACDARRELEPGSLARRLQAVPRCARCARARRRDRRRLDGDRAARRLRAAGGEPIREVRGDVLQPRVPAQPLPFARAAARAAPRHAARARDLRAPDARARHRAGRATRHPSPVGAGGARRVRPGVRAGDDGGSRAVRRRRVRPVRDARADATR